jgi:hypothetical protein
MNSHQEQYFSDFAALISPWAHAYQCATIAYVGLKTAQGPRLLFGRILLEPTHIGVNDAAFRFETEHLIAARFVSSTTQTDIKTFLEKAKGGEIQAIDQASNPLLLVDGSLSPYFSPIHHPFVSEGPRLPTLRVSGTARHNLTVGVTDQRALDWELKAAETPFDNLDELLSQCNLPAQIQMGDLTTLEIVAKSPVMISDASAISGSDAVIECRLATALDNGKLRLGYKVLHKESIERKSVNGSALDWRQDGDIMIGTYQVPVGNASLLQAFVSYAGVSHHQWWVTDPQQRLNPRLAIHQVFDEDLELLRRMLLKPETDKPYVFENAVSTLLNLLGFSVSNYGRIPKLQKGPDIIVVSPAGHVGVIECTVGLLDESDKLAKLVQRVKLIQDKLNETGYGFLQLQAAIVSPLSRDEVTANLETAGKHEIAVVCKENIEEMLKQVSLPPNADRLFDEAKRLVPNAGQDSLFGNNI